MKDKPHYVVILLLLLACISCQRESPQQTTQPRLTIAAAADLRFAMGDLSEDFRTKRPADETSPDIRVTYGSSGNFYAQLTQRAPFDMFFSADILYPTRLKKEGLALDDSVFAYGIGRIVVWVPEDSSIDVETLQLGALRSESVRRIAIANPEHAPYGRAAVDALKTAGMYDELRPKFVYGENISQAAQFVESGAADIGIVALALAVAPAMKKRGRYWEIPVDSFPTMLQGGLISARTDHPELAKEFRDYILGPGGQTILARFGFFLPEPE